MILLSILLSFFPVQEQEDEQILQPIRDLFRGMEEMDSTLVRNAFTDDPSMYTVLETEEGTKLVKGEFQRFLNFIGSPRDYLVAEPIWDIKIQQDGDMAQVWASYALYVGGELSHCGVDAFELIKQNDKWRIYFIADTRHKEGCEVPDEVRKKYEK